MTFRFAFAIGEIDYRGCGLGTAGIKYIQNYAACELGLSSLYLTVHQKNLPAIHAYASAGFSVDKVDDKTKEFLMGWSND